MQCPEVDFRRLFDTLEESILLIDRDCRICEANQAFLKRYGLRREDAVGECCHSVTHRFASPCWKNGEDCPVKALSEGSLSHRVVHRHTLADNTLGWEEIVATRYPRATSEFKYIIEEIRDAGELLRTREVIVELTKEVNLLKGIVPICSGCHKIRDKEGKWHRLETYIQEHSDANFSHGMCPDCRKKLYPGQPGLTSPARGI